MNKREKTIWAAGFLDGEGSLMLKRYKSKFCKRGITFQPVVTCSQSIKGKQTIELLYNLFGGSIKTHPQKGMRNKVITWGVVSRDAQKCIRQVKKFLIYKKEQADILDEFYRIRDKMGVRLNDYQLRDLM